MCVPVVIVWGQKPEFPPSSQVHISPAAKRDGGASTNSGPDYWVAHGFDLKTIIPRLYGIAPSRLEFPISLDDGKRYDFAVVLPKPESRETMEDLVRQAIQDHFQLTVKRAARMTDVFVLTAPNGMAPAMKPAPEPSSKETVSRLNFEDDHISGTGVLLEQFSRLLEQRLERLVVDETNLKGRYDFDIRGHGPSKEAFLQMLHDQMGLVLRPDRRQIEMLVVERH